MNEPIDRHAGLEKMRSLALKYPWKGQGVIHRRHTWDTTAILEPDRPTRILYTYDFGYHSSGWWKNSDYERCYHLSISHPVMQLGRIVRLEAPSDDELREWAKAAWPNDWRKSWLEPPATTLSIDVTYGRRRPNVGHVRLFLDGHRQPIQPEGEVYTLKPMTDGSSPEKIYR